MPGSATGTASCNACVYGCNGSSETGCHDPELDHPAEVHDHDPVRDVPHHPKIMRDEDVAEPEILAEADQEVHHLGLDRHVEGRDRLVEHHDLGLDRECAGDPDALALPTGHLVRVALGEPAVKPDHAQQLEHPPAATSLVAGEVVDPEDLVQTLRDGQPGVQGGERILEHELDLAVHRAQRPTADAA